MKAILEFDLNDFENDDRTNFEDAVNAQKWKHVIWGMDQWLRAQYKYMSDEEYSEDKYNAYVEAREKLSDLIIEEGLKLD